ncbi:hypothetical protein E2F47_22145 [Mycobacterium eburneum]|nr:hypothetical protein E2F47_22145 [Mycobacterium eburneum]
MLTKLGGGLIGYLHDAANGHTLLGESARRSSDKGSPMPCKIGPDGGEGPKTVAESFKGSPSDLLDQAHAVLIEWVRDVCEARGIDMPDFTPEHHPAAAATSSEPPPWLDENTVHIAPGNAGNYCTECFTYHHGDCA